MTVSEKIRKYVKSNGLKIKHIADKSDIDRNKLYRMLNGNSKMTVEEFESICKDGLGKEPSFFLENDS